MLFLPAPLRRLFLAASLLLLPSLHAEPSRWAAAIDRLTETDATRPPPSHGIVFVGSSSIARWNTLTGDFPGMPVIQRGFGGSELADSVFYLDRIVVPYQPKTVVLYAGENDIKAGKSPETVAADFNDFCTKLHAELPKTRIVCVSLKPSPSRWKLREKMEQCNALIAAACAKDPRLTFVDVWKVMLDADGQPRPELFVNDMLHMKPEGYALWIKAISPVLQDGKTD